MLAEPEVKKELDNEGDGEKTSKEEEEEAEDEGDESGSDDPDRLWCICQKPHDDRYKGWGERNGLGRGGVGENLKWKLLFLACVQESLVLSISLYYHGYSNCLSTINWLLKLSISLWLHQL